MTMRMSVDQGEPLGFVCQNPLKKVIEQIPYEMVVRKILDNQAIFNVAINDVELSNTELKDLIREVYEMSRNSISIVKG